MAGGARRAARHQAHHAADGEGERDDICAVGQTAAAHELCSGLRPYLKRHHMQAGVGHYGVFSGNRWTHQIFPLLKNVILASG